MDTPANIQIPVGTSFTFPSRVLIKAYTIKPAVIPIPRLYVKLINIIAVNDGMISDKSLKFSFVTGVKSSIPTIMRAQM